jgi:hypothetical protein
VVATVSATRARAQQYGMATLDLRDRIQAVIFAYETGLNRPAARS